MLAAYAAGAMPALAQEPPPITQPPITQPQVPSGIGSTTSKQSVANALGTLNQVGNAIQSQIAPSASPSTGDVQRMLDAFLANLIVNLNRSIAARQTLIFLSAVGPPSQRQSATAQIAALDQRIALLDQVVAALFSSRQDLAKLSVAQLRALAQRLQLVINIGAPTNTSQKAELDQLAQQLQAIKTAMKGAQPFAAEANPADTPAFAAMAYATRQRPASPGGAGLDLSPGPTWLAWTQAMGTSTDFGGAAPASGSTGQAIGGIEYRFMPQVTVGAMLGGERSRFDTRYNGGYFNGSGTMIAPYARFQLTPNVKLNVLGGTSFLSMDLYDGARTARFDATRPFVSAALLGAWYYGAFRFSPSASVIAGELRSDATVTSDGNLLPAANTRFGRVSVGPELGYAFPYAYGTIEPYAFAALERDFGDTSNIVAANGTVFVPGTQGAMLGGGLKIMSLYGWSGVASASYNSIGRRDENSWSGAARLEWKF